MIEELIDEAGINLAMTRLYGRVCGPPVPLTRHRATVRTHNEPVPDTGLTVSDLQQAFGDYKRLQLSISCPHNDSSSYKTSTPFISASSFPYLRVCPLLFF
jgi:hypothetical protein